MVATDPLQRPHISLACPLNRTHIIMGSTVPETSHALTIVLIASRPAEGRNGRHRAMRRAGRHITRISTEMSIAAGITATLEAQGKLEPRNGRAVACTQHAYTHSSRHAHLRSSPDRCPLAGRDVTNRSCFTSCRHLYTSGAKPRRKQPLRRRQQCCRAAGAAPARSATMMP